MREMAKARKDNKGRALRKGECQRKDQSYTYSYTDPFGRRKYIYAQDLQALREREKNLIRNQLDGLDTYVAGQATINYVFDRYMSTKYNLRSSTRSNYLYMYDTYVRDTFGKKLIADVKYSDVKYYYCELLYKRQLAANTVDNIHTVLHPTFQLAVRDDIIRANPTDGVMAEIKKAQGKNKGIRHALTKEQQKAFMDFVNNEESLQHWSPLFTVMFGTGCRIGEVIGLRWEDLDFEKRLININHAVTYYPREDRKSCYAISLPKTEAGIRNVPMIDAVYNAFKKEQEVQETIGFNRTVIDGMTGFIFQNRFGNTPNPSSINRTIKSIVAKHNEVEVVKARREKREPVIIPNFSCHITRHTFCTRLCENETNIKVIQTVMGHAGIETTMDIYAEATDEKNTEAIENLSKKLDLV
jgi:integrase